jgi:hydroxycarboxylate dehydrogenase B
MSATHVITLSNLNKAIRLVMRGFGSAPEEVEAVANNLIEANLTGHDSHGIGMLPRYAAAFLEGDLKPNTHVPGDRLRGHGTRDRACAHARHLHRRVG